MKAHGPLLLILACCLLRLSPLTAQESHVQIGVRGGAQMWLIAPAADATASVQGALGGSGLLDIRYAFYAPAGSTTGLGFMAGLGGGVSTGGLRGTSADRFSRTDYLGNRLDYTTSATYPQQERFFRAEAALLFALRAGGFVLNIGPRLMIPFASSGTLYLSEAQIDAYYPQYDVHVRNELITGQLPTPYVRSATPSLPQYNLLVTVEADWEWSFDRHRIGLQAFADVGVWQSCLPLASPQPVLTVSAISNAANPVPEVSVGAPDTHIGGRRHLAFGVRGYYGICFDHSRRYGRYRHSRDTRLHHNRLLR